jgi:molecular chaperone GrpE
MEKPSAMSAPNSNPNASSNPNSNPNASPADLEATSHAGAAAHEATVSPNSNANATDEALSEAEELAGLYAQVNELQAQVTELDALKTKNTELADQFLRAKAEADNTRRRAIEDESKARKFAIENFADALLPVRDSLEAALALVDQTPEAFREGVQATLKQLATAFERNKLIAIDPAVGDKLDPHKHMAISAVPAEQDAGTVVAVMQKGYQIAERTLRPAMVTVAAPK